ncbi:MAG: hypothetical protein IKX08_05945 [Lachnospiraceae bacterium]|jgi:hypothetical protein|nr:hypothetical protein [Lachnospiraceae bacterium]MBR5067174.1 hypothetical protein [Lachnospiraceae bacterium]
MKTEIKTINNDFWGELICFGDENGVPCFWGKKIKIKCLSLEESEVIVGMNLYIYDRDFKTYAKEDRIRKVNDDIKQAYDEFLSDLDSIDEIFLREYNDEDNQEEWDFKTKIIDKTDIYNNVELSEIEILKSHYHLVFTLDGEEWVLDKNLKYNTFSLLPSIEAKYPEMEYN